MTDRNTDRREHVRQGAAQPGLEAGELHRVLATSSALDDRTRVLKHGDTFAVFDHYGDIKPGGLGEEGLYYPDME
jgi:hypothetical protein